MKVKHGIFDFETTLLSAGLFSFGRGFFLLSLPLILGVVVGAAASTLPELANGVQLRLLFFSGIPTSDSNLFICFSSVLVNLLIFLILTFLLGLTVFGRLGVFLLSFARGAALGVGTACFILSDELLGLGKSAVIYTPAAAASVIVFLLFQVRALMFSENLRKHGFSVDDEAFGFITYFKDFLRCICLAVAVSAFGGSFAYAGNLFFSSR